MKNLKTNETKNTKNEKWENITKDELWELCVEKGYVDSMIAQIYGVTKGQVAYKRKKMGITQDVMLIENIITNKDRLAEFNIGAKDLLSCTGISQISIALTHYVFRNGIVENMHSAKKTEDKDIRILSKCLNNKLATLVYLLKENEWYKLLSVVQKFSINSSGLNEPEIEIEEVNDICKDALKEILAEMHHKNIH